MVIMVEGDFSDRNDALVRQVRDMQNMLDHAPDMVFRINREMKVCFVNQRVLDATGMKREDLVGKTAMEAGFPGEQSRQWEKVYQAAFDSGQVQEAEFLLNTADGDRYYCMRIVPEVNADGTVDMLIGVTRDSTERHETQHRLAENARLFRTMFDQHSSVMMIIDAENGEIVDANDAAARFYGYTRDALRHMTIQTINQLPEERTEEERRRAREEKRNHFVFPHRLANGEIRWVEVFTSVIHEADRPVICSIIHDITDRREQERNLQQSEARFRLALDAASIVSFVLDLDSWAVEAVIPDSMTLDEAYTISSLDEMVKMIVPEDREPFKQRLHAAIKQSEVFYENEFRVRYKDGRIGWQHDQGRIEYDLTGRPVRLVGISQDVTKRKLAEMEVAQSEEKLKRFIEHAPVALSMYDRDMTCMAASKLWGKNFGQDVSALIGRNHYELHPDIPQRWRDAHAQGMTGRSVREDADIYRHPDGTEQWVSWEVQPWMDAAGEVGGIVISFKDITAHKQSELKLQAQKDLLQGIFDHAPVMFMLWDGEFKHFSLNKHAEMTMGWSSADAAQEDFLAQLYPDPEYRKRVEDYMQSLEPGWCEWIVTCKDGSRFPSEWANVRLPDDTFVGIGVDLRERRRAERVQRRLAQFPLENPNPVMRFDQTGELLFANAAAWNWLDSIGWSGDGPLPEEVRNAALLGFDSGHAVETEIESRAGQTLWVSVVRPGGEDYVNLYGRDITQHKTAEKMLMELNSGLEKEAEIRCAQWVEAEARFRGLVEHGSDIFCQTTASGKILYLSPQSERYGFVPAEWEGRFFARAVHPDDREHLIEECRKMVEKRCSNHIHFRIQVTEDRICWFEGRSTVQQREDGSVSGITFILRDSTEKRDAEIALRDSEERYRVLFESESDAILAFDVETLQFVDVNPSAERLYGHSRDEFLLLHHTDISADEKKARLMVPGAVVNGRSSMILSRHRKKDGTVFPVEISASLFEFRGRKVVNAVIRDITERELQGQEIARNHEELRRLASELSLAGQHERQRVATELHDGVSQHLSSVCVRLDSLKNESVSPRVAAQLEKVSEVVSRALDVSRTLTFDLSCPLLDELGLPAALGELCRTLTHEHGIQFQFVGEQCRIPLSLDMKIVIFRAVRELFINVLKHSFAHYAQIELRCENAKVLVCVKDDGIGFDASRAGLGFSPTGGFGLFSIGEYIRHNGGALTIQSGPVGGTEISFYIPLEVDDGKAD
ncbi:MAG: PAS domain S-box protein [Pontiellaceae bacterium]|nr:PAS domain S-box protein [Pontiellaceae bacterium]MBN2783878.1 PAS domain S-box protein [Pontiellaceae bacterium]